MNFWERLKEAREKLGFNQNEFAENLQLAPQSLASYEKNKVKPTIEFIEKLTNMFMINSNWLINGKGKIFIENEIDLNFKEEILKLIEEIDEKKLEYFYYLLKAETIKK